jgi:hypothetical protein
MKRVSLVFSLIVLLFIGGCKPRIKEYKYTVEGIEQQLFVVNQENELEIDIGEVLKNIKLNYKHAKLISEEEHILSVDNNKIIALSNGFTTVKVEFISKNIQYTVPIGKAVSIVKEEMTEIHTSLDLQNMKNSTKGYYILKSDIDLKGLNWQPIGNYPIEETFSGMLINPGGYVIKNLTISSSENIPAGKYGGRPAGLFGSVKEAYIDGIILKDVSIDNTDSLLGETGLVAGGIAGYATNTIITNSSVKGTIKGINRVGGIVGTINSGYIENCLFEGEIVGEQQGQELAQDGVGGIAGFATTGPSSKDLIGVVNSHVKANLTTNRDGVGGIIGVRQLLPLINSTFIGIINGEETNLLIGKEINPFPSS